MVLQSVLGTILGTKRAVLYGCVFGIIVPSCTYYVGKCTSKRFERSEKTGQAKRTG